MVSQSLPTSAFAEVYKRTVEGQCEHSEHTLHYGLCVWSQKSSEDLKALAPFDPTGFYTLILNQDTHTHTHTHTRA